jgi:glutathione S-transferase
MDRYRLYGDCRSGNCYKAALILSLTGRRYDWVETDVVAGATRQPEFLELNPNGKVPLLVLPDGRRLAESNAMLLHLAEGTDNLPADPYQRALAYQWLFFEQYSHEPYIATSRFWLQHKPDSPERRTILAARRDGGWAALKVMEEHLAKNDFFVGGYTIADIALFAYTHVSHEGGFPLDNFPKICAWIERVKRQPGFIPMS